MPREVERHEGALAGDPERVLRGVVKGRIDHEPAQRRRRDALDAPAALAVRAQSGKLRRRFAPIEPRAAVGRWRGDVGTAITGETERRETRLRHKFISRRIVAEQPVRAGGEQIGTKREDAEIIAAPRDGHAVLGAVAARRRGVAHPVAEINAPDFARARGDPHEAIVALENVVHAGGQRRELAVLLPATALAATEKTQRQRGRGEHATGRTAQPGEAVK